MKWIKWMKLISYIENEIWFLMSNYIEKLIIYDLLWIIE